MHQTNSKNNGSVLWFKTVWFDIDIVSRRLLQWIETKANNKIYDIQQPDEYMTDSDT